MPPDLICPTCPNGCHLRLEVLDDRHFELSGQGCDEGLAFARTTLEDGRSKVTTREMSAGCGEARLREIAAFWGIAMKAVRPRLIPAGSPERTLFRTVIEDAGGARFVLEQIPAAACRAKLRIIQSLEFLSREGLAGVAPYRADAEGRYIHACDGHLWQLAPFIAGVPLDRGKYLYEGWRAEPLSRFLIDLKEKSRGIPYFPDEERFSIKAYILTLVGRIGEHAPGILPQVGRVLAFLERGFMDVHDRLPTGFCHGDYHPLNIIWGKKDIRAVIDWEFSGIKPEIYDLANMVGCLGMEHPSSLAGDLVRDLIARLRAANVFSDLSWRHFAEFVIALRFAWLSEWLRKDDPEMIGLELEYMALLIENHDRLARGWAMPG
jgi:homoserine kinase type II